MQSIPWVEKYRPNNFDHIILSKYNQIILKNIIKKQFYTNLLFYGPPGTGKTSTIINMIKSYNKQENITDSNKLIMHLNASDDRGIELIRNQLFTYVNSKNIFTHGKKIIILDEADYMTKMAQQALKLLIEKNHTNNVCFIIICNYITKIDPSLKNILLQIRFNNLPQTQIIQYLTNICKQEQIQMKPKILSNIQKKFQSDVRSMINFLQFNHIHENAIVYDSMYQFNFKNTYINLFHTCTKNIALLEKIKTITKMIHLFNIDAKFFWIEFFNELLKLKQNCLYTYIDKIEYIIHQQNFTNEQLNRYFIDLISHIFTSHQTILTPHSVHPS